MILCSLGNDSQHYWLSNLYLSILGKKDQHHKCG